MRSGGRLRSARKAREAHRKGEDDVHDAALRDMRVDGVELIRRSPLRVLPGGNRHQPGDDVSVSASCRALKYSPRIASSRRCMKV